MMLFLDTDCLDEQVNLKLPLIDFILGEMTILGKGSKERKVLIDPRQKALIDYIAKKDRAYQPSG
jgi:site-specific recombinase XerC